MAIRIIEGVPGAGKTFFAVHHILNSYFTWNETTDAFDLKEEFKGLVIVSNIDSFPYSVPLDELLEKHGGVEGFFQYEKQHEFQGDRKILYLIDEAQGLFPYKLYAPRVFLFFQKHRHLGMDVYLITQDAEHMAKGLRSLAEYHIRAVRRSYSLAGEFRYQFLDPTSREVWRTKLLRRDRRVFAFYRSMDSTETEKHSSVPLRFMLMFVGVVFAAVLVFKFGFIRIFGGAPVAAAAGSATRGKVGPDLPAKGVKRDVAPVGVSDDPVPSARGRITGAFVVGDGGVFLVEVAGGVLRLSSAEMTRACKCHVETLAAGVVLDLYSDEGNRFVYRSVVDDGGGREGAIRAHSAAASSGVSGDATSSSGAVSPMSRRSLPPSSQTLARQGLSQR